MADDATKSEQVEMAEKTAAKQTITVDDEGTAGQFVPRPAAPANVAQRWFRQMGVLLKKNMILLVLRYWKSTLLQIVAPLFFLLLLYGLQAGAVERASNAIVHPLSYPLGGVAPCIPHPELPCITVMFAPASDPVAANIMNRFAQTNKNTRGYDLSVATSALNSLELPSDSLGIVGAPSEQFIYDYVLKFPNVTQFGVVFNVTGDTYRYRMWYNSSMTLNATFGVNDQYDRTLAQLMRGIDEAILSIADNSPVTLDVQLKDWPGVRTSGTPEILVSTAGAIFYFCCATINFINVLNAVVTEKEQRLRHAMEMMGLMPSVYWISWFLSNLIIILPNALLTVAFGRAFGFSFFTNADFGVTFVLFFLFQVTMSVFAFFLSTLVRQSRSAVLMGIFILIIGLIFMMAVFSSAFIGYIWWEESTDPAGWIVLMFIPFFNFGKLYVDILTLASGKFDYPTQTMVPGPGFNASSLYSTLPEEYLPGPTYHVPPPIESIHNLIWNAFFYAVLTWYLDNVIPDEYGQRRSLYFFLTPEYWGFHGRRKQRVAQPPPDVDPTTEDAAVYEQRQYALSDAAADEAIRLVGLRKVYPKPFFGKGEDKVAVMNSSWTVSQGKLLALLGQNGAGKSTTINILCGFVKPSAGDAFLFGNSIIDDMDAIRADMGVCPQFDMLFADLTAREHIELFAGIKNVPADQIPMLIEERLSAVKLMKVADQRSGTYSGGMKRRLSCVISTIGDPRIIFLDEPTTGMDPVNRRYVWKFVEQLKPGRVIVLTTHSMEEADILGDSIAIMALGRLRAYGTSVGLKNKFGAGYRVSLVAREDDIAAVRADAESRVPGIVLEDDSAGALIFTIPAASADAIPSFVQYLESGGNPKVREWGISQTTLEEVFLQIIRSVNPTARGAVGSESKQ